MSEPLDLAVKVGGGMATGLMAMWAVFQGLLAPIRRRIDRLEDQQSELKAVQASNTTHLANIEEQLRRIDDRLAQKLVCPMKE